MSNFYGLHQLIATTTTTVTPAAYTETKFCLICNTLYPVQQTPVSNEFGSFYLENFCKILNLPVGSIEEDLKTEVQPFCMECRHKLGECFRLLQQLESIAFELEKVRDDIGKSVVESFSETSYLRSNYVVKQKVFQQYYHKFQDDANTLVVENTVSTSDFSDLLTTGTIPCFTADIQESAQVEVSNTIKKPKRKRRTVSKAIKQETASAENQNSGPVSQAKKSVRQSKRKSSLKNQNDIQGIEEMIYDFDPDYDSIDNVDNTDFNSEIEGRTSLPRVEIDRNQLSQSQDTPFVKKTKYQCRYCGKYCTKSNHLVIHERMHTDERPFPCSICGKAFREKGHVLRHEKTHDASRLLGEKTHLCPECGKAFVLADSLYNHRREKHMGKPQKRNIVSQMCETCGKVLHSLKSLKKHVMIIHEKQKPHSCPVCEKKFSYLCNKKLHIERHHRIKCPEFVCSTKDPKDIFESREAFENHFKTEHPDSELPPIEEPRKGPKKSKETFNCDKCHRVFKLSKWLEDHIQKVHSDVEKPAKKKKDDDLKTPTRKRGRKPKTISNSRKGKSRSSKTEVKIETESDESNLDSEPKKNGESVDEIKVDMSFRSQLKRSPRLASQRKHPQRTISESEADITEAEESDDEDNDECEWQSNEIKTNTEECNLLEEDTSDVKQEPDEVDSLDI